MKYNCKLIESAGRLTKVTKKNYEESQKTFGLAGRTEDFPGCGLGRARKENGVEEVEAFMWEGPGITILSSMHNWLPFTGIFYLIVKKKRKKKLI